MKSDQIIHYNTFMAMLGKKIILIILVIKVNNIIICIV